MNTNIASRTRISQTPPHLSTRLHTGGIYKRHPINLPNPDIPYWFWQFRVLQIRPGAWNDELVGTLRVLVLDSKLSADSYSALSYVWGEISPTFAIKIDGQEMRISQNLFTALRRLRAHNPNRYVNIFADALCINQADVNERSHQVTLMGKIYSRCANVLFWFGELETPTADCFTFDYAGISKTKSYLKHQSACQCRQKDWLASRNLSPTTTPSSMAKLAAPILLRLASVKTCDAYLACRLFDSSDEMVAFRFLMSYLASNAWFGRMWTVQEGLLARKGRLYFGQVSVPLDTLFDIATIWETHKTAACCSSSMAALDSVVAPLVKACFFLGHGRRRLQDGLMWDMFAMRIEYAKRRASVDLDLLYGLLGVTDSDYTINPDYRRSVVSVFTDASRDFLQSRPKHLATWIFIYSPCKHRYPNMPSWAVDWTTLEQEDNQNSRYTWTGLQYEFECGAASQLHSRGRFGSKSLWSSRVPETNEIQGIKFCSNALRMSAYPLDTIRTVGVAMDQNKSEDWYHRYRRIVEDWRTLVLMHHAPGDMYTPVRLKGPEQRRHIISQTSIRHDWSTAWLKMLCAEHVPEVGRKLRLLLMADLQTVLKDATQDPTSLLLLQPNTGTSMDQPFSVSAAKMVSPELYQKLVNFIPQAIEGKRMFMTSRGFLGFGNVNIRTGDQVSTSQQQPWMILLGLLADIRRSTCLLLVIRQSFCATKATFSSLGVTAARS